ncbi:hypothetical protein N9L47_08730 [Rhodobacteraceae bacterium]|nr:hypothetical protein [Paracoccaceae bacterium]
MDVVLIFLGTLPGMALAALFVVIGLSFVQSARRRKSRAGDVLGDGTPFQADEPPEATAADLPIEHEDPDLVERIAVSRHIADLMLADEWTQVGDDMSDWETDLAAAPGGARYHDVGADVALSGLRGLIDEAEHNALSDLAAAEEEIDHFMDTYHRNEENHVLAVLAARAHLMVGEAARADLWPDELQRDAWRVMARHFVKAGEILQNYDTLAYMSPLLAEAKYRQALGSPGGAHKLDELFESWIDLDPSNPLIYEIHAESLCDPDVYSDEAIMAEADKALARTEDTLGMGGYALFFMPLLELREGARDLLDADLFAGAMLDLASMEASQAEVNLTANALAAEMRLTDEANTAMNDTLYLLIRWHMSVIYPRLWTLPETSIQSLVRDAAEAIPDLDQKSANLSIAA